MLFKRYLFLAACVLVFIFGFIGYFTICRAQMDSQFLEEREKYNVQGVTLTSSSTPSISPAPPVAPTPTTAPVPAADSSTPPASATPDSSSSTPTPATSATSPSTDSTSPAMNPAAADPSVIIGPVPPPPAAPAPATDSPTNAAPASTPDNSTNAAPATTPPDSTAAPMAPSSTMNDPRQSVAPFLVRAAYQPLAQADDSTRPGTPTPAEPVPNITGTNHPLENTNAVPSKATATNAESTAVPVTNVNSTNFPPMAPNNGQAVGVEASVIVLGYHQFVGPGQTSKNPYCMRQEVFESEMKYLKDNNYHVVPLSDVVRFVKHEIGLPPNSVAISIDDGYKSAIVWAAPVLKKYGFPWTYFVYPDFITVAEGKGAASWNDLLALQADGVDVESHTMTHPFLTHKTQKFKGTRHVLTPEEYDQFLTDETLGSKTLLEQKLGKTIRYLAYPYGDYNKQVEAKAIAAGYESIFTVADNPIHSTTNIYAMGRYVITQPVEKDFAAYLRQGALGLGDVDPAPGSTINNPRPVITAVLGYAGTLDPNSIETSVRDFGIVKHDFDPKTSTIRLYLPRDLVLPVNLVNIRVKDAQTGQIMVANWHFNYQPSDAAAETHAPIGTTTNGASTSTNAPPATSSSETPMTAATNVAPVSSSPAPAAVVPAVKPASSASPASSKAHQD